MKIKKWAGITVSMFNYLSGTAKKYHEATNPKSIIMMLCDHIRWISREGEFNFHYYSQGLDSKGRDVSDVLGRKSLTRFRKLYEGITGDQNAVNSSWSEELLIRDKFYCSAILHAAGFRIIDTLFLFTNGICHPVAGVKSLSELTDGDYFLKNTLLESGEGVKGFSVKGGAILLSGGRPGNSAIDEMTRRGRWIVQEKILSHSAVRAINGTALNTTRIFTMATRRGIEYLGGYQAFATGSSGTDSWQHGSVYVKIDALNNRLGRYGITSQTDPRDGVVYQHPDSKVTFDGYEIPFMSDAVSLCCNAHSLFNRTFIIGWDIAITQDGPRIVEANENPGINVLQCFEGGIRNRVKKVFGEFGKDHHE